MPKCEVNSFDRSVYEIWKKRELNELMTKVFNRLKIFFIFIVEGNGENELVESKRGKRFHNLDLSVEQLSNINVEKDAHDVDDIDEHIDQFFDEDDDELNNEIIIIEG